MGRKDWDRPKLVAVPLKLFQRHVDPVRGHFEGTGAAVPERPVEVSLNVLWVLTIVP